MWLNTNIGFGIKGSYNVFNVENKKWLYIRNNSSFWDSEARLILENFVRENDRG